MKKNLLIISLIFILPIFAYFILSHNSSSTAAQKPETTVGKPVIIKFSSSMCMDCKRLSEVMKDVCPAYEKKIVFKNVMVEDNNQDSLKQIKKYKVVLVPTLVFIDSQGRIVKKTEGYMDKETLENYLKELINGKLS